MTTIRTVLALTLSIAASGYAQQGNAAPPRHGPPPQGAQPQGPPPQQRGMHGTGPMREMQGGGADMRQPGPPIGGLASMLLAHTAELKLTDQQLPRLAAIARRTDDRHRAMRTTMDSTAGASRPQGDQSQQMGPRSMPDAMRATMERTRGQGRGDVRDALAVLTLDQLADAWLMRGPGGGPGPRRR